jgi:hypothetical protein
MDNEQIWSDLRLQALRLEEMSKDIKSSVRNKNRVAAGLDAGNMLRQAQAFFDLVLQLPR